MDKQKMLQAFTAGKTVTFTTTLPAPLDRIPVIMISAPLFGEGDIEILPNPEDPNLKRRVAIMKTLEYGPYAIALSRMGDKITVPWAKRDLLTEE